MFQAISSHLKPTPIQHPPFILAQSASILSTPSSFASSIQPCDTTCRIQAYETILRLGAKQCTGQGIDFAKFQSWHPRSKTPPGHFQEFKALCAGYVSGTECEHCQEMLSLIRDFGVEPNLNSIADDCHTDPDPLPIADANADPHADAIVPHEPPESAESTGILGPSSREYVVGRCWRDALAYLCAHIHTHSITSRKFSSALPTSSKNFYHVTHPSTSFNV